MRQRERERDIHDEGLLPADLCLVTLLSSEQCSQFESSHSQYVQKVNQTSSFTTQRLATMQR